MLLRRLQWCTHVNLPRYVSARIAPKTGVKKQSITNTWYITVEKSSSYPRESRKYSVKTAVIHHIELLSPYLIKQTKLSLTSHAIVGEAFAKLVDDDEKHRNRVLDFLQKNTNRVFECTWA
jgi:hypothetical protein